MTLESAEFFSRGDIPHEDRSIRPTGDQRFAVRGENAGKHRTLLAQLADFLARRHIPQAGRVFKVSSQSFAVRGKSQERGVFVILVLAGTPLTQELCCCQVPEEDGTLAGGRGQQRAIG